MEEKTSGNVGFLEVHHEGTKGMKPQIVIDFIIKGVKELKVRGFWILSPALKRYFVHVLHGENSLII